MDNIIFLCFLSWWGINDLRHRRIKHWQVSIFALYMICSIIWNGSISYNILLNTFGVLILGWLSYIIGRWGAADVKIITVSSLYHFYSYNSWWVWQALLLTALIDLGLWGFYFHHRNEDSPLLFAWMIAVISLYIWFQI